MEQEKDNARMMINEEDKEQLIREFFTDVIRYQDDLFDDSIYYELDPEYIEKYGEKQLAEMLNFNAIREVIELGVKAKYGVDLQWK